ncbi:hypothetical protein AURDEDRAFT_166018 [Auricularia subglabra TFB-10046 SS5]|nr:hypothetical protein AURDEDRAFT_166018 [Auricularia subglabra TFB-10046 SS5]
MEKPSVMGAETADLTTARLPHEAQQTIEICGRRMSDFCVDERRPHIDRAAWESIQSRGGGSRGVWLYSIPLFRSDLRVHISGLGKDPQATGLANRCGLMFFMVFANKDGSVYGSGKQGYSSDTGPFFANTFNQTPEQVAEMFQGYAMTRKVNVPAKDLSNNVGELKKEARRVISKLFRQFERREKAKIFYNPLLMLNRYNLQFVGWEDGAFPNPGELSTAAELHKLLDGLNEGKCGFQRVDKENIETVREEIMARANSQGRTLDKPRKERSDKNQRRKESEANAGTSIARETEHPGSSSSDED